MGFLTPLKWTNILFITILHVTAVACALWHLLQFRFPKWQTIYLYLSIFLKNTYNYVGFLVLYVGGFGVTGGVHRYWSHRSNKAKIPLQIILLLCFSTAGQNNIFDWVRDHRVHHKFSETSVDPHNVHRGFFFSHIGWLMMKKHPAVVREGAKVDMNDIINDPLIQFHTKYFTVFKVACCFVLPTMVPLLVWDETWGLSLLSQPLLRHISVLHIAWSVNSFTDLWGNRPYDRHIMPVENWGVSAMAMGEGWHNHHSFPWDYKAVELAYTLNMTTILLDFFAKIGWAYDMKQASPSLIKAVARNRGSITPEN